MPMAAEPASSTDRDPPLVGPTMVPIHTTQMMVSEGFAKDAVIAWYRGEFAAANAIIDALCVIQMQKYHSIADVSVELRRVDAKAAETKENSEVEKKNEDVKSCLDVKSTGSVENGDDEEESPDSEITDSGSQEMQVTLANIKICSNHEQCEARTSQIKLTKGFAAKELVKGHMVNVVTGLKLYEDIFTVSELCKLTDFVNVLHAAGRNGELPGETYILFNKQMKGNKRELIQLGVPIFGQLKEHVKSNLEPIPALLQGVIDHLIQWQLLPEYKRPNGCIINFFEEGEYSQPFMKPPHLDQPVLTLLLSESSMAFGRTLVSDTDGNYQGPLMLWLKPGSLLVMRGNSADMARHVMCQSSNRRVSITFFLVRPDSKQSQSPTPHVTSAMTLWQPGIPSPYLMPNGTLSGSEAMDMMPKWGVLCAPMVMLNPMRPMVLSPCKLPRGGTGVFLPWNVPSRKPAKHIPPRAQKGRLLALPSPVETHMVESTSEPAINTDEKVV
ncbi:2OG-Fe(II) oxygenase family oxidoreductase [Quillaja saponaria]|uniref:2OG-Fe(II) oxygenase family oxidoreductase n=1 Tax=Quillaja saponaria TaxID=32244 RepID=A0AAD7Q9J6_QUISA|nr:2OG-Fe(II) oxygenase family oxidoreductase [Quillaja saponaria]